MSGDEKLRERFVEAYLHDGQVLGSGVSVFRIWG